jgi:catechol 2,3-dioxygenase-like lactoylglutathione lyase family enzyme
MRLLLERLAVSTDRPPRVGASRPPVPTFAEYVPVVSATVGASTRRVYGSYWSRVLEHWGTRRLDEPTPSDIEQLAEHVRTHAIARRNARGGRSAVENLIAALRCLYHHAVAEGYLAEADNPARKVAKPRRLPRMAAVTLDLFAGIPVRDYATALAWYERLLGHPPAFFPNDTEAVWELAEHRYVYIKELPEHAGHALHTVFVDDLDLRLAEMADRGLEPTTQETYDNGVRKATFVDPDGNEIGFGGGPVGGG